MSESSVDEFGSEYGAPVVFVSAQDARTAARNANLPKRVFEYWERYGFSKFLDGYFQILNPADYQDALALWLHRATADSEDTYHALTMDSFGSIQIWGEATGHVFDIDVSMHAVFDNERNNVDRVKSGRGDRMVEDLFFFASPEKMVENSEDGNVRLFFAAKNKLGDLGHNQIYAPVPAIPLGGQMRIDDLQIVDAPSYLTMVAEIEPPRVMTIKDLTRLAFGDGADETLAGLLKE